MTELRGNMEAGPLGLSSCLPFSSSRPMTPVEDLGKDSLGSGCFRMRRNVSTSSAYWMGCQTMLLPCNKEGQGHVGGGPDRIKTCWRAWGTYAYVQGTDPPLKTRVKIWPSTCVLTYQSAFGPTRGWLRVNRIVRVVVRGRARIHNMVL